MSARSWHLTDQQNTDYSILLERLRAAAAANEHTHELFGTRSILTFTTRRFFFEVNCLSPAKDST